MEITKEEIIEMNKKYDGHPLHIHNLDFDWDMANQEKNIYKSNAHLLRGIVAGHAFDDGCKSTATEVIVKRFKKENINCQEKPLAKFLVKVASKKYSINKIERSLRKICK